MLHDPKRQHPLLLREAAHGSHSSVHVQGLSSYLVSNPDDVLRLLRKGTRHRAVRGTEDNAESSRSHSVMQLEVQIQKTDDCGQTSYHRATLSLVDLAGSEKWKSNLSQVS